LILFLLFLGGCASHIIITPEGCRSNANWLVNHKADEDISQIKGNYFTFTRWIWTPLGPFKKTDVSLKTLLRWEDIPCERLDTLTVTTKTTWYSALMSAVPFMGGRVVVISGTTVENPNPPLNLDLNEVPDRLYHPQIIK